LIAKTLPTYAIADEMIKNILFDCKIFKTKNSTNQHSVYYYMSEGKVILKLQIYNEEYSIEFNPYFLYYSLSYQPYRYKVNIRKAIMDVFDIDYSNEHISFDNDFYHGDSFKKIDYNYIRKDCLIC